MRVERPRPKTREEVPIPKRLRDFFAAVHRLIEAGAEEGRVESDDLLQCEFAYGGLIEEGGARYGFTYFPGAGRRDKWELDLGSGDLASIADGATTTLTLWACGSPCGCRFSDSKDLCLYCDYVDEEGSRASALAERLRSANSREAWVADYLGENPDAHALQVIGDYNSGASHRGWEPFSFNEMRDLIEDLRSEEESRRS